MPAISSFLAGASRVVLLAALLALLIGLPVAVDMRTSLDTLHGQASTLRGPHGVVLREALAITALPGLVLESAFVTADEAVLPPGPMSRRLALDGARLRFDVAKTPVRAPAPPHAGAAPPAALHATVHAAPASRLPQLATLDVDSLLLRHAVLEVAAGDRMFLLTDVVAEMGPLRKGGRAVTGLATYGSQRVRFAFEWRNDGGRNDGALALKARVEARFAEARFDGHVLAAPTGPRLTGDAQIESRKLRALLRWFGLPVESGDDLVDARIAGGLDWTDGVLAFDRASVRIDGNEASGALTIKTTGGRPSIEGTLGFAKLDIGRYVDSLTRVPGEIERPIAAKARAAAGGPRPLLALVDADLRLSAGKVVTPSLETGRGALTLVLRQGRLQADLAELEVERGRAMGQITVDVGAGDVHRVAIKGRAIDVDPGRVFAPLLKRNPLFGRATVSVDLAGSGTALPTILAGLSGKGVFTLADGGKLALDLRTLVHAAQTSQIVGWSAAGKGSTSLDALEGRFALSNGHLTIESLAARSGSTNWRGAGRVDLAEQLLDLVLTLAPSASDATDTVREALAIRGTWFDPAISLLRQPIDPSGAAGGLRLAPSVRLRD